MAGVGGVCGLVVWAVADQASVAAWVAAGAPVTGGASAKFWRSVVTGTVFAPVLWGTVLATRHVLLRRVPLTSGPAAAVHVAALVAVTAVALTGLLTLDDLLCAALGVEEDAVEPTAAILVV